MRIFLQSAGAAMIAAFVLVSIQPAFANDAAVTRNDNLLPWIATVQVPPGVSREQLRKGVRVEVPGDEWPPTHTYAIHGPKTKASPHVYATGIRYFEHKHDKYHFWIQDMSNGSIHGVASNAR